ncbi:MAG: helix-turn-helix transcriptional regulator [Oscillospiraceae bacterium]|nr:helix-turn-helix transcriptional regulator [Oscillospiraceae bacterium]
MRVKVRRNLQVARKDAGLTQQAMADKLGISLRYYQQIEAGSRTGDFEIWDNLEDITGIHQRTLREISPGKADSR